MYQTDRSLPAILESSQYTSNEAFEHDVQWLRGGTWQMLAAASMLAKPGNYYAATRLGVPVMLRHENGQLVALRNVCAHRQCSLVEEGGGHAEEIKCPYHGWRYGADGRTRKIPGAKNFPHFDREAHRLAVFPVRQIGQLVFVKLRDEFASPSEDRQLDISPDEETFFPQLDHWDEWQAEFAARSDANRWRLVMHDELEYACDWKIPIEGSLESYHLAEVHPQTFGEDPGEAASDHRLLDSGTTFDTDVRATSLLARIEEGILRIMTGSHSPHYRHVHVFPNVMASFTDTLSLYYQIHPVGVARCRISLFGFARRHDRGSLVGRMLSSGLGRAAAGIARRVLAEDAGIFVRVQHGMGAAVGPRIFGRSEERLHAFHRHWAATLDHGHNAHRDDQRRSNHEDRQRDRDPAAEERDC